MTDGTKEQRDKLLQLVRDAVKQDEALRAQFQIGDKFRFIRDRLQALLAQVEEGVTAIHAATEQKVQAVAEDEMVVYVYLYNAQGLVLQTWQKMLKPTVFYEYSVNRPIYPEKAHVESFIRSRPNKVQHGYLTVVIKKADVLQGANQISAKDAVGNPLIKVKENSLRFEKMVTFTQGDNDYIVNAAGELVKKS